MTFRKFALLAAVIGMAAPAAGCISLFPKSKPSQLYRFGADGAGQAADAAGRTYNVSRAPTVFTRAAAGDRILTMTGAEAAYVAGSRWVAPAATLFDEAAARTFDAAPGCARLLSRGDASSPDARLRLEVRTFEVRYLDGPGSAPTAVVEATASLSRSQDREVILDRVVRIEERAADNRVGAIVAALDTASSKALSEIAGAVNGQAASEGCGVNRAAGSAVVRRTTTTTTSQTR
jgi:cholesterol transport system auxiliary component